MASLKFDVSVSLDGYLAGPRQSIENPLGEGGLAVHDWKFATKAFRDSHATGDDDGETGVDDVHAARWNENVGATIMGRNMFGPVRGPWGDSSWNGWWGDDPPYHTPVFVLTHHAREPVTMQGGTTFEFVTDGIEQALERAVAVAEGLDVSIGGGAETVQQFLRAGLVDAFEIHVAPVLLGGGSRLFENVDGALEAYECVELASSPVVAHFTYARKS